MKDYEKEKMAYENFLRKKWADILMSKLHIKTPILINSELAYKAVKKKENVYAHICYLKPGKHSMFVTQNDEMTS